MRWHKKIACELISQAIQYIAIVYQSSQLFETAFISKLIYLVCLLPSEFRKLPSEVPVYGSLAVNRVPQTELIDNRAGTEVENIGYCFLDSLDGNRVRTERIDMHGYRFRHADCVSDLHLAAFRQSSRHDVLRDVPRVV